MAAMAVAFATPVAAQDTATDFRDAYTSIYGESAPEPLAADAVGLGVLSTISGTWVPGDFLMNGPDFDAETLTNGCGFSPILITNLGNFGFQTENIARGEPVGNTRTYMFTSGRYFSFVTDLNGLATRLFGDGDLSSIGLNALAPIIASPTNAGVARVEFVGPDVLVMDSPTAGVTLLVRCP